MYWNGNVLCMDILGNNAALFTRCELINSLIKKIILITDLTMMLMKTRHRFNSRIVYGDQIKITIIYLTFCPLKPHEHLHKTHPLFNALWVKSGQESSPSLFTSDECACASTMSSFELFR
jgi:hypothetical protein